MNVWTLESYDGDRGWFPDEVVEISKRAGDMLIASGRNGGDYLPRGRFVFRDGDGWTGINNDDGNAWTEHFRHRTHAILHAAGLLPSPSTLEEEEERANGTGAWAM